MKFIIKMKQVVHECEMPGNNLDGGSGTTSFCSREVAQENQRKTGFTGLLPAQIRVCVCVWRLNRALLKKEHARSVNSPRSKNKCHKKTTRTAMNGWIYTLLTLSLFVHMLSTWHHWLLVYISKRREELKKEYKKITKRKKQKKRERKDFKMYKYPAITITIIETPATWY